MKIIQTSGTNEKERGGNQKLKRCQAKKTISNDEKFWRPHAFLSRSVNMKQIFDCKKVCQYKEELRRRE